MEEPNPYAPPQAADLRARPEEPLIRFEFVADQSLFFQALDASNEPPGVATCFLAAVILALSLVGGFVAEAPEVHGAPTAVAALIVFVITLGIGLAIRSTAISRNAVAVRRRISDLENRYGLTWGVWRAEFDADQFRLLTPTRNFEWQLTELSIAEPRTRATRSLGGTLLLTPDFLLPIPVDVVSESSAEGLDELLRKRVGKPIFRLA